MRFWTLFPFILITAGAWLSQSDVQGFEIKPYLKDNDLCVVMTKIPYPEQKLENDLLSGLPTEISITVQVISHNKVASDYKILYTILYDLWDEIFYLTRLTVEDSIRSEFHEQRELMNFLQNVELTGITTLDLQNLTGSIVLRVTVVINPVTPERIRKIQSWVEENGVTIIKRSSPGSDQAAYSATGPRFKKVFDKIFEQYLNADQEIGYWKQQQESSSYKIEELSHE